MALNLLPARRTRPTPLGRQMRLRRARTVGPGTAGLAVVAAGTTIAVVAAEIARVWKREAPPAPAEPQEIAAAAGVAAGRTVEVAVEGYRDVSTRENAIFNLLVSFVLTFAVVRAGTWTIRARGEFGPFRNVHVGDRHIHHVVPGVILTLLSGGAALLTPRPGAERWLAVPFGIGAALTLDESALLVELDDVYWTEEGIVSVQVTLATAALIGGLTLALRFLRRGEQRVLGA